MRTRRWIGCLLGAAVIAVGLTACGGGGGNTPPNPAEGSKWNQMFWNQGKWGPP